MRLHALLLSGLMMVATSAVCQTPSTSALLQQAKRQFKQEHSMRHAVGERRVGTTVVADELAVGRKSQGVHRLPSSRVWFPGEWEEVQAIVVTWPYLSMPADWQQKTDPDYWQADPVFSGFGDIYHYEYNSRTQRYSAVYKGMGPIVQLADLPGRTYDDQDSAEAAFVSVFANLIDGIQQGGAEAWVRVSNASDSTLIKNHLQSLGLRTNAIRWLVGEGNSFWFRDCGPICFYYGDSDSIGMLDFVYYPGRPIDDSLPALIEQQMHLPNFATSLQWEGGNCLVDGAGRVFTSDALLSANADTIGILTWNGSDTNTIHYARRRALSTSQVADSLAALLGPRGVHILPHLRYDGGTGHVDLYADMYDENRMVFSRYPSAYSRWTDYGIANANIDSICSLSSLHGVPYTHTDIPFPCKDDGSNFASQNEYGGTQRTSGYTRTYSNHVFVNNVIIQPCFSEVVDGQPSAHWDSLRIDSLRHAYEGYTVLPIDVRSFDGSGGAIHCITKQIPAEHPIRILHRPIGPLANSMGGQDMPVTATVDSREGIATVVCHYRINQNAWQTDTMHAHGLKYVGRMATSELGEALLRTDTADTVSYYFEAVSLSGKRITKPFVANQGAYFRFVYTAPRDSNSVIDSLLFNFDTTSVERDDITFLFGVSRTPVSGITEPVVDTLAIGQFFPNPTIGISRVRIDVEHSVRLNVTIIDQSGRVCHTAQATVDEASLFAIDASRLPVGMYYVVFDDGQKQTTRRLVVSR